MTHARNKSETLTLRLTPELRGQLDRLSSVGPYKITITSIVERGIELAAQELERAFEAKS